MKYIWPSPDILSPVLPASIVGKQMAILPSRKQDAGAAQPRLFVYQGHKMTSWALQSIHSARAPSPHFLQDLHGFCDTEVPTLLSSLLHNFWMRGLLLSHKNTLGQELAKLWLNCLIKGTVLNQTQQVLVSSHRTPSGFSELHPAWGWKDCLLQHQVSLTS